MTPEMTPETANLEFRFGSTRSRVFFHRSFRLPAFEGTGLYVFDAHTEELFGGETERKVVIPSGEKGKSWQNIAAIEERAIETGLSRDSSIVGVGGGMICDMAAFAASLYMRGCRLILVPTTLLAMVDAALGGKTGINYSGYKNMLGTYYPAGEIHVAPLVLQSLSEREYRSGLAEVIKTALLGEEKLFQVLRNDRRSVETRDLDTMGDVVRRCMNVKGGIVEKDPREQGIRAHLNFGHTFGHALEASQDLSGWTHGEAVAWGIARALDLGVKAGITDPDYSRSVKELLREYGFAVTLDGLDVQTDRLLEAMTKDKKKMAGAIRFVIQKNFGETEVREFDRADVRKILC